MINYNYNTKKVEHISVDKGRAEWVWVDPSYKDIEELLEVIEQDTFTAAFGRFKDTAVAVAVIATFLVGTFAILRWLLILILF